MKKLFLFTALSLGVISYAQKFEAGFNIGYVNSTLDYTSMGYKADLEPKHSLYVSVPMEYHANRYLDIFVELAAAGLGAENLMMDNGERSRLHLTSYLIPIGVKVRPFAPLGLVGGFTIGFIGDALGEQNGEMVRFENLNNMNNAYFFGAEYKFTPKFVGEVRYSKGISNIINNPNEEMKNNYLQIGIGYKYDN